MVVILLSFAGILSWSEDRTWYVVCETITRLAFVFATMSINQNYVINIHFKAFKEANMEPTLLLRATSIVMMFTIVLFFLAILYTSDTDNHTFKGDKDDWVLIIGASIVFIANGLLLWKTSKKIDDYYIKNQ